MAHHSSPSGETAGDLALGTLAIHGGQAPDPTTGAVMPPIYATSTYAQSSPGVHQASVVPVGDEHPDVVALRSRLDELDRSVGDELVGDVDLEHPLGEDRRGRHHATPSGAATSGPR